MNITDTTYKQNLLTEELKMTKNKKMNTKELDQVTGGIDMFSAARHLASSDQLASGLAVDQLAGGSLASGLASESLVELRARAAEQLAGGSLASGSLGGALDSTLAGGFGAPGNKLPGYSPASGKGTLA